MAPALLTRRPKILYLDAYHSCSNSIIAQVQQCVEADIVKCYINDDPETWTRNNTAAPANIQARKPDDTTTAFFKYVKAFDAVIAGPGPGSARCDTDVGWIKELWRLQESDLIPVLGIGLGFQSMSLAFGADIQRLDEPCHGRVAEILHHGTSIFGGVKQLRAVQYHSLQVMIQHRIQTKKAVRYPAELWEPTESCPELQPLAWDFTSKRNGAVLVAAKHVSKPFWAAQFHPESACTNSEGMRVIQNWWHEATRWNRKRFLFSLSTSNFLCGNMEKQPTKLRDSTIKRLIEYLNPGDGVTPAGLTSLDLQYATTGSGRLAVADIVELFDGHRGEAIVLESGLQQDLLPIASGTGRHSIVGLITAGETMRLHYYCESRIMQLRDGHDQVVEEWLTDDPWQWVKDVMAHLRTLLVHKPKMSNGAPFWGGFMGYATHEAGLKTLNVQSKEKANYPDICFAYITRSIVVDHQLKKIYIQSIRKANDMLWVNESLQQLYEAVGKKSLESTPNPTPLPKPNPFDQQDKTLSTYLASRTQSVASRDNYCASVGSCQKNIANGQSYQLSLMTTFEIRARRPRLCQLSKADSNKLSWNLYRRLAARNKAPFGAYMRLHNVHILSSSPEQCITWDRRQTAQCRPTNGTVTREPGVTVADADAILSSPNERAENLTMVDLTRHQLLGVYGAGNVYVRQFMQLAECERHWQLESLVEGAPSGLQKHQPPDAWEDADDHPTSTTRSTVQPHQRIENPSLGFDAFVHSLPPARMTGAPKQRACDLLQAEERHQPRGISSGVMGYLDIGGGGAFSVVTRAAIKIDDVPPPPPPPPPPPSSSSSPSTSASASASELDTWILPTSSTITARTVPEHAYEDVLSAFQRTAAAFEDSDEHTEGDDATAGEEAEEKILRAWRRLARLERGGGTQAGEEGAAPLLVRMLQDFQDQLRPPTTTTTAATTRLRAAWDGNRGR